MDRGVSGDALNGKDAVAPGALRAGWAWRMGTKEPGAIKPQKLRNTPAMFSVKVCDNDYSILFPRVRPQR